MYPHERSLVERLAEKPFALLGVNSDPRPRLQELRASGVVTWRSFWDGGSTSGPIAKRWGIRGWPQIFVIDDQGILRHQGLRGEKLEHAVEQLIERSMVTLTKKLRSEDPAVRGRAAFQLGKYGRSEARDALRKATGDPAMTVRQRAAVALVLLGEEAAGLVPLLREAARDEWSEVAAVALPALGAARDEQVRPLAEEMLDSDSLELRRAAARTLGSLRNPAAAESLIEAADHPDVATVQAVVAALAQLGPRGEEALQQLAGQPEHPARTWATAALHRFQPEQTESRFSRLFRHRDPVVRRQAAAALQQLDNFDAMPLLADALDDRDHRVRQLVGQYLATRDDSAARAALLGSMSYQVDRLVEQLQAADLRQRSKAVTQLENLGPDAVPLMIDHLQHVHHLSVRITLLQLVQQSVEPKHGEQLFEALRRASLERNLRFSFEELLRGLGKKSSVLVERLATAEETVARESAARMLTASSNASAVKLLRPLLHDASPRVRVFAAYGLARQGELTALPVAQSLADDRDAEVRNLAVAAIGNYHAKHALPVLRQLIERGDRVVRVAAVSALGNFKTAEATQLIQRSMQLEPDVRPRAVYALRAQDTHAAAESLEELLQSGDAALRRRARAALEQMKTPEADEILRRQEQAK